MKIPIRSYCMGDRNGDYPPLAGAGGGNTHRKPRLERAVFKVSRFTDDEVLKNINAKIEAIQCVVEEREKSTPFTPASGGQAPHSS